MYQHFPRSLIPTWYWEGFAETAATIVLEAGGSFHIGNPPQYRAEACSRPAIWQSSARQMLTMDGRPNLL